MTCRDGAGFGAYLWKWEHFLNITWVDSRQGSMSVISHYLMSHVSPSLKGSLKVSKH